MIANLKHFKIELFQKLARDNKKQSKRAAYFKFLLRT